MREVPVVLCVDVEPDGRRIPVPGPTSWTGFDVFAAAAPELRDELAAASGRPANLAWFLRMDPQVEVAYGSPCWVHERYGAELDALAAAGDELGIHSHNWHWDGVEWSSHQGDPAWIAHCTRTSLEAYEACFGRPAPSYRGGDRYFDAAVFAQLRASGVGVDLSIEPGVPRVRGLEPSEPATGWIPAVPAGLDGAFVPSVSDPLVPSPSPAVGDLLAVPLTSGVSFVDGDADASSPPIATLTLWSPPRLFAAALDARLAEEPAHLAFAVRADVGTSDVAWPWFRTNLRHLAERLGRSARWCTPGEAASSLRTAAAGPSSVPVRDAVAAGRALEGAVRDAELALLRSAQAHAVLQDELAALQSSFAVMATAADERLVIIDDVHRELERLRAEVADYATSSVALRAEAERGRAADAQLAAVLATRWWRLHGVIDRVATEVRTRSRRR